MALLDKDGQVMHDCKKLSDFEPKNGDIVFIKSKWLSTQDYQTITIMHKHSKQVFL